MDLTLLPNQLSKVSTIWLRSYLRTKYRLHWFWRKINLLNNIANKKAKKQFNCILNPLVPTVIRTSYIIHITKSILFYMYFVNYFGMRSTWKFKPNGLVDSSDKLQPFIPSWFWIRCKYHFWHPLDILEMYQIIVN